MTAPFRVAVIGAGPAGFYLVERLLAQADIEVDLFERLPAPYGLVRYGVAPDHEKIRNVTRVFDRIATNPRCRYFGNVAVGEAPTLAELRPHYHHVAFATGAQTDRRMGIPGEDLAGSHTATEFVAWYNGHPDYRDREFDLSAERVAVVGMGNVAVDVARMLCRTHDELATTDTADYALDALRRSRVREVLMLGRRGVAQAAFTTPEVRELGELAGADVHLRPDEVVLDPVSEAALAHDEDAAATRKKVDVVQGLAGRAPAGMPRTLTVRFLVSPVAIVGDTRVRSLRVVRNRLEAKPDGSVVAVPTGVHEDLAVDLVFRSVGYRGVPITGLPFDDKRGVVPNDKGRVTPGLYVCGWIKRGPSGVIGTNKPDAAETAETMLADLRAGATLSPDAATADAAAAMVRARQPRVVSYADWQRLQALEAERGKPAGRPRVRLTSVDEMLAALQG